MSSDQRTSTVFPPLRAAHVAAVALSLSLAGCSADVTRFDGPGFNLTGEKSPSSPQPRSGLTGEGLDGVPPPSNRVASLPPPSAPGPGYASQPLPPPTERTALAPERRARPATSGEMVEVHAGDTISAIARRHHVTVAALSDVNNLTAGSTIKPGQKLALPAGAHSAPSAAAEPARTAPAKLPVPKASRTAEAPAVGWEGKHTLRAGESIYGIARHYKVTTTELQRVNDITDPARVRIGTVLKVPAAQPGAVPLHDADPAPAAARTARAPAPAASEPATPAGITPGVRMLNQPERKAALSDRANDASPAPVAEPAAVTTSSAVHFPWPARGKVIGTFGKGSEGIKIQMTMGTDVRAVEGGKVIYASSEMQTYGNLVLIQHDNGWVSAYGHADRLLVHTEDVVKKGQVIAKSGRSGTAEQPQLHFELRQGSKPMDPIAYLDK